MIEVIFTDASGVERVCLGAVGDSLMKIGTDAGVEGMGGECRGQIACATCIVTVDRNWLAKIPPPESGEAELLEACERELADRLGCQVLLSEALNGLKIAVAPDT